MHCYVVHAAAESRQAIIIVQENVDNILFVIRQYTPTGFTASLKLKWIVYNY